MFDDDFIQALPGDRMRAAQAMCERFREIDGETREPEDAAPYESYLEALGAFAAFCDASGLSYETPAMGANRHSNILEIRKFFNTVFWHLDRQITNVTLRSARERFAIKFGAAFVYEFSDGDLARIQTLVNELRDLLVKSEVFEAEHKERLLKKLESLQSEIHKKVASLDKFWGLIGEAGVALGKFGKDAKPFVDRIREIAQIVWRTQARAEELPSATPLPLLTEGRESE